MVDNQNEFNNLIEVKLLLVLMENLMFKNIKAKQ